MLAMNMKTVIPLSGAEHHSDEPSAHPPEAEPPDECCKAHMADVSPLLLGQLRAATLTADLDGIWQCIQQIQPQDGPVAVRLKRLAETFEYPALLNMIAL